MPSLRPAGLAVPLAAALASVPLLTAQEEVARILLDENAWEGHVGPSASAVFEGGDASDEAALHAALLDERGPCLAMAEAELELLAGRGMDLRS